MDPNGSFDKFTIFRDGNMTMSLALTSLAAAAVAILLVVVTQHGYHSDDSKHCSKWASDVSEAWQVASLVSRRDVAALHQQHNLALSPAAACVQVHEREHKQPHTTRVRSHQTDLTAMELRSWRWTLCSLEVATGVADSMLATTKRGAVEGLLAQLECQHDCGSC